jgi:hypothetical protein
MSGTQYGLYFVIYDESDQYAKSAAEKINRAWVYHKFSVPLERREMEAIASGAVRVISEHGLSRAIGE